MRSILLIVLICIISSHLLAEKSAEMISRVGLDIASLVNTDKPLFLDIRTGEFSPTLERELKTHFLKRKMDLREMQSAINRIEDIDSLSLAVNTLDIRNYGLTSAMLLQVDLDITWQQTEQRKLFSYQSFRVPVYVFDIKLISLPEYRLTAIYSSSHKAEDIPNSYSGVSRLKWFEPFFATAALGSLVFLLWTTE